MLRDLAQICVVIVALTTPLAAALANLETRLFNAAVFRQAVQPEDAAAALPQLVAESIRAEAQIAGSPLSPLRNIEVRDIEALVSTVAPPELLATAATDLTAQLLELVEGKRTKVSLSLLRIRSALDTPEGAAALTNLLAALAGTHRDSPRPA